MASSRALAAVHLDPDPTGVPVSSRIRPTDPLPSPDDALDPGTAAVPDEAIAPPPGDAIAPPRPAAHAAADLALVAGLAAFTAACALAPAVPTGIGVPITLQTFAVVLAGLVLGARRGAAAIALYLLVGLVGFPVFAGGRGGLGVLAGPTVGYLLAFVPAAAVAGALAGGAARVRPGRRYGVLAVAALASSLLVVHPLGIAGLMWRAGLSPRAAVLADLPFVPGDVAKALLAAGVAVAVLRAFPDLLRERS